MFGKLDLEINDEVTINLLIEKRVVAEPTIPEFVSEADIKNPADYNRFCDLEAKEKFREKMVKELTAAFSLENEASAASLIASFREFAQDINNNGALILGNMISKENFIKLITKYRQKLSEDGSKSWIHSYINFGNHPDFLTDQAFNGAFAHPLLIALIAYSAGGPIRIVDARGKDAEPLSVQAQDNMLHIDNTPFRKEFKLILTWEKDKPNGPKGQNFVFLPGTHKGVRQCKITPEGEAWSTEDNSIFITEHAIEALFNFQQQHRPEDAPAVVEVTHPEMPLSTVFEAGALVHHRYRTQEKNIPRSCIILAFHRAQDNPGEFLSEEHLQQVASKNSLPYLLMGKHSDNTEEAFIAAIVSNTREIGQKLEELRLNNALGAQKVHFSARTLKEEELSKWMRTVTLAPTIETIKADKGYFKIGDNLSLELLTEMMKFDKHGPLDLILYADGHEEIRKWARNRIREMPLQKLQERVGKATQWNFIKAPDQKNLLTKEQLKRITEELADFIKSLPPETKMKAYLDPREKIAGANAYRSLYQLLIDLGESIERCASRQTFLSTSLFIFWACDEISMLLVGPDNAPPEYLINVSTQLLSNYISTYVLIEKQIELEKQQKKEKSATASAHRANSLFSPQPSSTEKSPAPTEKLWDKKLPC